MNFKTTIGLLLLLGILGVFFYFLEKTEPPPGIDTSSPTDASLGRPLFKTGDISAAAVDTITIVADDQTAVLEKKAGNWTQAQPVEFPLDSYAVRQLIDDAAGLRYADSLAPGSKNFPALNDAGLAPPKAVVTLQTHGDKPVSHTIKLGRDLVGKTSYVMIDDDPKIYVAGNSLQRTILDRKVSSLRSRSLMGPKESQADRVTLAQAGQKPVTLIKTDGAWSLGPPHSGRADLDAVSELLRAVASITIGDFVADAPRSLDIYGLDQPRAELTVRASVLATPDVETPAHPEAPASQPAAQPVVHILRIGAPTDLQQRRFHATWTTPDNKSPVVFTIAKAEADKFTRNVDSLRDPRITPVKSSEVRRISLAPATQPAIDLDWDPATGWDFNHAKPASPKYSADTRQVFALIEDLTKVKAASFTPDYQPKAAPATVITISALGTTQPEILKVFAAEEPGKKEYTVIRNNETTGYVVPAEKLAVLFEPALALRDRQVVKLDKDRLTKVEIHQSGGVSLVFTRTVPPAASTKPEATVTTRPATIDSTVPGPWKLQGQDKFEEDGLSHLIAGVTDLLADRWITAGDAKPGPDADTLTLTEAEGKTVTLTIDPKTRVATASGVDAPFEVSKVLADAADAEYRFRTMLSIPHGQIKQVTIAMGGKSVVLETDPDGKFVSPTIREPINQQNAGGIFDALAGLKALRILPAMSSNPPGEPLLTAKIVAVDGAKHELAVRGDDTAGYTAVLDDKWFTLDKETVKKLQADPAAKERPMYPMGMPRM